MKVKEKQLKIKICFVSILGYPLYNKKCTRQFFGGGAGVQLYILSKELANNPKFDVHVITGNYNLTPNKIETIGNMFLHNLRPFKRKISFYFLSLLNLFIYFIRINPDIIIQRQAEKVTGICAFYCKLFKKKFLFSIANLHDVNGELEKGFFGKFYKYGLENANHIIAQNNEQIKTLEKLKKKKIENISILKSSYKINLLEKKNKKYILWVGRAIDWKRPELFIKLAEMFSDKKFLMICNKSDEKQRNLKYWSAIKDKASKISNLEFIEYVPFHNINAYFEAAEIFINTSIYEGFPNTFIQSSLFGTPIISLNVNPDGILTKNKIGLWCENNFDLMVKNLNLLLDNDELYLSFSENCYNFVKKNHNINKNVDKWIQIINNVLK
ncbi:MAG: glycosyltransferase [Promethearchaeota archaeon]